MNWNYKNNDKEVGPISSDTMMRLHACGMLSDDTWVRNEQAEEWLRYDDAFNEEVKQPQNIAQQTNAVPSTIDFTCPHCKIGISAELQHAGSSCLCPSCKGEMVVPAVPVKSASPVGVRNPRPDLTKAGKASNIRKRSFFVEKFGILSVVAFVILIAGGVLLRFSARKPTGHRNELTRAESMQDGQQSPDERNQESQMPTSEKDQFLDACKDGNSDKVKVLIDKININEAEYTSKALSLAAKNGHLNVVEYLLKSGANVNKPDCYGDYPIHGAAADGNIDFVKLLVKHGAKIDQKSSVPYARKEDNEIRREVNMKLSDEYLPIHIAAKHDQLAMVQYFIGNGIPHDVKDGQFYGSTPLDYAVRACEEWGYQDKSSYTKLINFLDKSGKYTRNPPARDKPRILTPEEVQKKYFPKSD